MKTTAKEFAEFRRSFVAWQCELGMMDYRIDFVLGGIDRADVAAELEIRFSRKVATAHLCESHAKLEFNPANHGKHEAIHLFLSRLSSLAHSRFLLEREIDDAEEGMVRVLERVLK